MRENAETHRICLPESGKHNWLHLRIVSGQNMPQMPELCIRCVGWFVGTNVIKIMWLLEFHTELQIDEAEMCPKFG